MRTEETTLEKGQPWQKTFDKAIKDALANAVMNVECSTASDTAHNVAAHFIINVFIDNSNHLETKIGDLLEGLHNKKSKESEYLSKLLDKHERMGLISSEFRKTFEARVSAMAYSFNIKNVKREDHYS